VVDTTTDKVIATIPDTKGVHGIAIANDLNKGFISDGGDNDVTVFDLKTNTLARTLPIPGGQRLTGVWAGEKYYLLGYGKGKGTLWGVTPETQKLADGKPIDLHELGGDCRLPGSKATEPLMIQPPLFAGSRLVMYEGFGYKFDRRGCATPPSGGVYVIDPASGSVVAHLAPSLYFTRLAASRDGTEFFGIEVGPSIAKYTSRLIRLDPGSGKILASRELNDGMAVHLSLALLFDSVIPHGEVQAVLETTSSWMAACPVTKPVLDEPPSDPKASPFGFGEWYISESRSIWFPRQGWRAGSDNKVILIRPAGVRLAISGRRLDGPAPPLELSKGVSEYPGSTFEVIGMTFPAEGCWEVTAKAGDDVLRFVTTVAPARKPR
ncbi:MAG: YncE family protein, partial [Terriglobia bacterium]